MRLTVKERVLLHLLDHARSADDAEVSPDLAQEGIADAAGFELRHFAAFVRPLIEDGLVRERQAHVVGIRLRRKVYALTPSGRTVALRLREKVTAQPIRIRDGNAVREGSLHEALQGAGAKRSLLETVRLVEQDGLVDLESVRHPPEAGMVEQLADAPRLTAFVGRREELGAITHEDGGPRVFVIRGMAGIGKSSLAAKACELVRGRRNLFWHRIRPWESDSMVLANLGRFLDALDRPGLGSVLRRGEVRLAAEVLRQDLPDTHSLLVLDDAHEASPETLTVIRMMAEAVVSAPDVKLVILTRRALPFYDIRDVVIRGVVREIELGGLKPEEVATFLSLDGQGSEFLGLGRRLGGHPLLIELVRKQTPDIPAAVRGVHRFIEETIYRELTPAERTTMKAASLYRVPVPRSTLLAIPGSSFEALTALRERSLLRSVGDERYEVHDTIRDFFGTVRTPQETLEYGTLAVSELHALSAEFSAAGDLVASIDCLSNAIRLTSNPAQKAELLEDLGDAEGRMGDLPAVLVAYREALGLVAAPGSAARLHRKGAAALQERGETASAEAEIEQAERSLGERDDVEHGWLNLILGRMSLASERWSEGRECAEAALRTFRPFGDLRGQAEALIDLSIIDTNAPEGRPEEAEARLGEALRLGQSIGDPALVATAHVQFANLEAYRLGNADRALVHLDAVDTSPRRVADVRSRLSLLMMKGWLNLDLRANFEEARANFSDALTLATKTHDRVTAALAGQGVAVAAYHAGDCFAARAQLEAVGQELLDLNSEGPAVEALWMVAEISLVVGDLAGYRAAAARLHAPVLARGLKMRPVVAHVLAGVESLARADETAMRAAFLEAIREAEQEGSPQERPLVPFAHDFYGAALQATGDVQGSADEERTAREFCQRFGLNGRLVARARHTDGLHRVLGELFTSGVVSAAAR